MSSDEVLEKFDGEDENERAVIHRFLTNLFLLYDGVLPPSIESHIRDLIKLMAPSNFSEVR